LNITTVFPLSHLLCLMVQPPEYWRRKHEFWGWSLHPSETGRNSHVANPRSL